MQTTPIKALKDNYIWAIHNSESCIIVDPGEAKVVLDFLTNKNLSLAAILITHHHYDHTDGIQEIHTKWPNTPIIGHKISPNKHINKRVLDEEIEIMNIKIQPIPTPGHTLCHLTYLVKLEQPLAFTGDTLFSAGCGKIFEGTAAMMLNSLNLIASLPDETLIYCGHEYTLSNLRFAHTIEPNNTDIAQAINTLSNTEITLPSSLKTEKQINPFLRCKEPTVQASVKTKFKLNKINQLETFTLLRQWKNNF